MHLFFASGDIGGARALTPVIKLAEKTGEKISVLPHGAILDELPADAHFWSPSYAGESIDSHIGRLKPDRFIFATSVSDKVALDYAAAAKKRDCKTAMLLDNWSSYMDRLIAKNGALRLPDLYAVMDQLAFDKANAMGIPSKLLEITGSPALSNIPAFTSPKKIDPDTPLDIVFINEPVASDQGSNPNAPSYRGYTEKEVLSQLCDLLAQRSEKIRLWIFPHPRDDVDELGGFWREIRGDLDGGLVRERDKAKYLESAHRIIGMASILLYEAWLRGFHVMSLQPGVQLDSLRYLEGRPGLAFVDSSRKLIDDLDCFLNNRQISGQRQAAMIERERHLGAANNVLNALKLKSNR